MIMTFGKYKGQDIEYVPSSYLKWLIENSEDDDLIGPAEEEYQYRSDHHCHFED